MDLLRPLLCCGWMCWTERGIGCGGRYDGICFSLAHVDVL